MKIGIICGQQIPGLLGNSHKVRIETSYGDIFVETSKLGKHDLFYISRHGEKSNLPPHKVNYLGNIQAFSSSHVKCILSIGTVGSMKKVIQPGDFLVPHDFIDFTKSRKNTFYDNKRVHVDMTEPYCPSLRESLIKNSKIKGVNVHEQGVYLSTEGARLETVSEIQFFSKFADVVGMTGVPEVVLTREKGICYAALCIVCNMAAGLQNRLVADEIKQIYKKREQAISNILKSTIKSLKDKRKSCNCKNAVDKASL